MKRILCLALIMALVCGALGLTNAVPRAAAEGSALSDAPQSALLRVYLSSLGAPEALTVTLRGEYTLGEGDGFRFDDGTTLTLTAREGSVWMQAGPLSVNLGEALQLCRHGDEGGLTIDEGRTNGLYCGSLMVTARGSWLRAILLIDVEAYVKGVVPYEMNDAFPAEALKAQAVAARSYALWRRSERTSDEYDLVDTTADQVFNGYSAEYKNANAAVDATAGLVGLFEGRFVPTYYTASNGGATALPGALLGMPQYDGYLQIRADEADLSNPYSRVSTLTLSHDLEGAPEALLNALCEAAAPGLEAKGYSPAKADIKVRTLLDAEAVNPLNGDESGQYESIHLSFRVSARPLEPVYGTPTTRDRVYSAVTGQAYQPKIIGHAPGDWEDIEETFTCDLPVYDFFKRELDMGLNAYMDSETVSVETGDEGVTIALRRYGHGVGMSQRGAQTRAGRLNQTMEDILAFYYPGLDFVTLTYTDEALPPTEESPLMYVQLTPDAVLAAGSGERMAKVATSSATGKLNVRSAPSLSAAIVAEVYNGARLIVTDAHVIENDEGTWLSVRTREGAQGYCAAAYLVIDE